MKLFRNKFFLVCLCIALILAIVPSVFSLMGYQSLAKNIVGTVTFPVRWCITAVADGFSGFGTYFQSVDALVEENEKLRDELNDLRERLDEAELLDAAEDTDKVYVEEVLPGKMYYNLKAIENFSFFGDIKVMFMTVFAVLGKEYNGDYEAVNDDMAEGYEKTQKQAEQWNSKIEWKRK